MGEPAINSPMSVQSVSEPSDGMYEVEKIVGMAKRNRKVEPRYKVRWKGYSSEYDTWESESNLASCMDFVEQFKEERRLKDKMLKQRRQEQLAEGSLTVRPKHSFTYAETTLKDTFWNDLEEGRVNVFATDLYSRVKASGRTGKEEEEEKDGDKSLDSTDNDESMTPNHSRDLFSAPGSTEKVSNSSSSTGKVRNSRSLEKITSPVSGLKEKLPNSRSLDKITSPVSGSKEKRSNSVSRSVEIGKNSASSSTGKFTNSNSVEKHKNSASDSVGKVSNSVSCSSEKVIESSGSAQKIKKKRRSESLEINMVMSTDSDDINKTVGDYFSSSAEKVKKRRLKLENKNSSVNSTDNNESEKAKNVKSSSSGSSKKVLKKHHVKSDKDKIKNDSLGSKEDKSNSSNSTDDAIENKSFSKPVSKSVAKVKKQHSSKSVNDKNKSLNSSVNDEVSKNEMVKSTKVSDSICGSVENIAKKPRIKTDKRDQILNSTDNDDSTIHNTSLDDFVLESSEKDKKKRPSTSDKTQDSAKKKKKKKHRTKTKSPPSSRGSSKTKIPSDLENISDTNFTLSESDITLDKNDNIQNKDTKNTNLHTGDKTNIEDKHTQASKTRPKLETCSWSSMTSQDSGIANPSPTISEFSNVESPQNDDQKTAKYDLHSFVIRSDTQHSNDVSHDLINESNRSPKSASSIVSSLASSMTSRILPLQTDSDLRCRNEASPDGELDDVKTPEAVPTPESLSVELSPGDFKNAVMMGEFEKVKVALDTQYSGKLETVDPTGMVLLMVAAQKGYDDIVDLLIGHGSVVNAQQKNGTTALMLACEQGHLSTATYLVEVGASINLQQTSGETALMKAIRHGRHDIVNFLLFKGANFHARALNGSSAVTLAKNSAVESLLNLHRDRVTEEFDKQVQLALKNTAKLISAIFPIQCFPLCEGPRFTVNFNHDLTTDMAGIGYLLFIAHARISEAEITCRFYGPCAISSAHLNGTPQYPVPQNCGFVLSFCPLNDGKNELIINTVTAPTSKTKLLVCAYKAELEQ